MDLFIRVLSGIGIGFPSGLNPYLPLLILSVGAKGNRIKLNPDFEFLNSWPALIVLAILVGLDIFADKFPQIENLYRAVNLLACPIAGGIAVAAIIPGNEIPSPISFVIGLLTAEIMYLVKSNLRKEIIAAKGNLKLFGPLISMGEDLLVGVLTVLAAALPLVGGPLSLIVLALYFWWFKNSSRRNKAVAQA